MDSGVGGFVVYVNLLFCLFLYILLKPIGSIFQDSCSGRVLAMRIQGHGLLSTGFET